MKTLYLLLFALFVDSSLQAGDCVGCTGTFDPFSRIIKSVQTLQEASEIKCDDQLREDAKAEYLSHFSKQPVKQAVIRGLRLQGSAEELKFLEKMLNDKPTDQWNKAQGCSTVVCALSKVYNSEEAAHRVLSFAKREGYIISASKDFFIDNKDGGQLFSLKEIQKIDLAYKVLPASFKKLKTLDRIKRLPNGYTSPRAPNAAAYASPGFKSSHYIREGEITFLESGFEGSGSWGPNVAVHELAHHVDFSKSPKTSYGFSESQEYLSLSGWTKKVRYETDKSTGKKKEIVEWSHDLDKQFVTRYASTEPAEDFAESAAHYVYAPNKLKSIDPKKYDFLKNKVFGGKEFQFNLEVAQSQEEIFKSCMEAQGQITLWGKENFGNLNISDECLGKFMKDFSYTDPVLCNYNPDQIREYLQDGLIPKIKETEATLSQCNQKITENRTACFDEKNYTSSCPIEKCQLPEIIKSKVKDNTNKENERTLLARIEAKEGREKILGAILLNGLSEKRKVSLDQPLQYQKDFLEKASKGVADTLEQGNYKFDSKDQILKSAEWHIFSNKTTSESLSSFQKMVLKKATKSKEKNKVFVEEWVKSQSLGDEIPIEQLAEMTTKYAPGFFGF